MVKKINVAKPFLDLALFFSTACTYYFLWNIIKLVSESQDGSLSESAAFASFAALVLGMYVWTNTNKSLHRYSLVSIGTIIIVGYLIWIFGLTGIRI